ncbi:Phage head-tail joining protein [Gemmata obscuriglobus]|uniref:Head-tail adaptor protein n=1 Tax=Gemmata obscuriglobus TaxID=114 RepID=A0A2Z3GUR4_9BACT|nr:phage head closure protein [Gemmata obscuriglobus]AWM37028.1 head-tail adaptor protein [Gemmata obscuriglobus]QEG30266.1 Phage head-tail joining protein [Gemmata obscuriglobus]VTS09590.1 Phage head-tail adaptor OS=Desulfarculus baarsii (strain ATCC 33931 / DSM 2075 / VKM B-1802 / 2st14) GN=Deba_2544 PE=4 SV=1: Phage_H_T_join [Gemmata obscuriglobus UQM 2246]
MAECCAATAVTLKKRVTVQNVTRTADGQGGFTETWDDAATVWCSVEPVKAWERYQAAQLQAPVTHKIVMRYTRAVTPTSRLVYQDRIFHVKEAINRNEEGRFLDLRAVEV